MRMEPWGVVFMYNQIKLLTALLNIVLVIFCTKNCK